MKKGLTLEGHLREEIVACYQRLGSGVQMSVMDIPKFFDECLAGVMQQGRTIEEAVTTAIAKYRKN